MITASHLLVAETTENAKTEQQNQKTLRTLEHNRKETFMREVVVVGGCRTAIGAFGGGFLFFSVLALGRAVLRFPLGARR